MGAGTAACPVSAAAITVRKRENRIRHSTPDRRVTHTPERDHANITMSSRSFTLCNNSAAPTHILFDQIAEPARPGGRSAANACGGLQNPPRLRCRRDVGGTAGGVLDAWRCRDSVSFSPATISLHRISRQGIPYRHFRVHDGAISPFSQQSTPFLSKYENFRQFSQVAGAFRHARPRPWPLTARAPLRAACRPPRVCSCLAARPGIPRWARSWPPRSASGCPPSPRQPTAATYRRRSSTTRWTAWPRRPTAAASCRRPATRGSTA